MVVGEYIRTPKGIGKITNIYTGHNKQEDSGFCIDSCKEKFYCGRSAMKELKSSPNIIDLIEENDYVNGSKVIYVNKKERYVVVSCSVSENGLFNENEIKSIVTKEMYSSVEYRVENN